MKPDPKIYQHPPLLRRSKKYKARAYVALERVKGTLRGKTGGFVLYHVGTMTPAETILTVKILNDSGTGDLKGISGTMTIRVEGGKHFYDLDYSVPRPEKPPGAQ